MNIYDKNHPHNAVFVAQLQSVIEGKPKAVDSKIPGALCWSRAVPETSGFVCVPWEDGLEYRLAPATVTRTITYPEPMRVAPGHEVEYWTLDLSYEDGVCSFTWGGCTTDKRVLKRGMVFANESDAKAAAAAIFGGEV